jgi:hypothetical protein
MQITVVMPDKESQDTQSDIRENVSSYNPKLLEHLKEIMQMFEENGVKSKDEERLFDLVRELLGNWKE